MFPVVSSGFPILFSLVFGLIFIVFIFTIVSNIVEWSRNQASDVRMRNVRVVAKRTNVRSSGSAHMHHAGHVHRGRTTHTTYYATFEFLDDGTRTEFRLPAKQYGLLVEGDLGILNYQGTPFNAFERTRKKGVFK